MLTAANFLYSQFSDNILVLSLAASITALGITYGMIKGLHHMGYVNTERQIDTTRVDAGLPTDVTLTPEDFRANPELAEIFEITDTENDLNLILESQEHLEMIEAQQTAFDSNNITALFEYIEDVISYFF